MRKAFIVTILGFLVLLALSESGIINSLMYFILVGAIPGTAYTVPAGLMLLLIALASWLIIFRFTALNIILRRVTKQHIDAKKRMPRRRYSQI